MPTHSPVFLGIDTGGTYTDAVLWSEKDGILAKAKSLTTRYDLARGIAGAVDAVLARSLIEPSAIKLVSMSTTLATNALVEGQGGRVALVMIGFSEEELSRDGLRAALGSDPVIFCNGGHDVHGNPTALDLASLNDALPELTQAVSAFAVCAYFATRNPAHEIAACERIQSVAHLPVTASHQLTSKLGGPRRALTTLLNARLIAMIDRLVEATEGFLAARGIAAPLLVVRGDGALVSAAFARQRPIETILSGPAASLVGAKHLTGLSNAVVSDIGGTTTDVAVLDNGRPRLDPEGATVGGFRTMVEAVAMRTFGLGGDSEVSLEERVLTPRILLGPRRLVPLALAARLHSDAIHRELERQLLATNPSRMDGRFAVRTGLPERLAAGLNPAEKRLYETIGDVPLPIDRALVTNAQMATLNRLVSRGLVHLCGFTPSDAAHVLGKQDNWDAQAARLGADLFARRRDGKGQAIAASGKELSLRVLSAVTRASAETILETSFAEDGFDGASTVAHDMVQHSLDGKAGIARLTVSLDRPVIGLGASASLHYSGLAPLVGNECLVPPDADVANALGAVVGQVRIQTRARVSQPSEGIFRLAAGDLLNDFVEEADAMIAADRFVRETAQSKAINAGAAAVEIEVESDIRTSIIEGRRMFIEADVIATASGRPRLAE